MLLAINIHFILNLCLITYSNIHLVLKVILFIMISGLLFFLFILLFYHFRLLFTCTTTKDHISNKYLNKTLNSYNRGFIDSVRYLLKKRVAYVNLNLKMFSMREMD